ARIVGEGWHRGGEFSGIVVSADLRRQLPGREGKSRWRAQRAVAVEGIEDHPLGGESIDVRRAGNEAAVGPQRARGQLIGHENEEIGTVGHGCFLLKVAARSEIEWMRRAG